MFGLPHTTLDAARLDNLDVRLQTDHALHTVGDLLFQRQEFVHLVGVIFRANLDLNLEGIGVVHTIDHNQVVRIKLRQLQNNTFHLRWEDIHTADDQHIVASSQNTAHPNSCSSAKSNHAYDNGSSAFPPWSRW